jgi:hypothetical protein
MAGILGMRLASAGSPGKSSRRAFKIGTGAEMIRLLWEFLFGCGHSKVASPQGGFQRCLDCGAWRPYRMHRTGPEGEMLPGIDIGRWQAPERPGQRDRKPVRCQPEIRKGIEGFPVQPDDEDGQERKPWIN